MALDTLRRVHLDHPCAPGFMPNYIRLAHDLLDSIRTCLQGTDAEEEGRAEAERQVRIWEEHHLPFYALSCIGTLRMQARLHAVEHLPAEQRDQFLAESEAGLERLRTTLEPDNSSH